MRSFFVSYRRADSDAWAGRIADGLARHFGPSQVFIDVDDIPTGEDFRQYITERLRTIDVMLVIIGPGWLAAADGQGNRRLDSPDDLVRRELAMALQLGLTVIPVLVAGATMPAPNDLPGELRPLALRNAAVFTSRGFKSEMAGLIQRLEEAVKEKPDMALARWYRNRLAVGVGLGLGAVLLAGGIGWAMARTSPTTTTTPAALPVTDIDTTSPDSGTSALEMSSGSSPTSSTTSSRASGGSDPAPDSSMTVSSTTTTTTTTTTSSTTTTTTTTPSTTTTTTTTSSTTTTTTLPPCAVRTVTVTPNNIQSWATDHLGGDLDFASNGPHMRAEVWSLWEDERSVQLQIYWQAMEDGGDWTQASAQSPWITVYEPPAGYAVRSVTAGGSTVPARGRGSDGGNFGWYIRGSPANGAGIDPSVRDYREPVAAIASHRDTDEAPTLVPGEGLVSQWRFVGDTAGDDLGPNRDDDAVNVTVIFNQVSVTIRQTDGCT